MTTTDKLELDLPAGTDPVNRAWFLANQEAIDAAAAAQNQADQPFYVSAAEYNVGQNRLELTIEAGAADWGPGGTYYLANPTTFNINAPSTATTYHVYVTSAGSFASNTTGTNPDANAAVRIATVTTGAALVDALTIVDKRGKLAGAFARYVYEQLGDHEDLDAAVHGVTGDIVGTTDAQSLTNKAMGAGSSWGGDVIAIGFGGTGQATATAGFNALSPMSALGDLIYGGASGTRTRLAGNTTSTKKFLRQTGDGVNSAAPAWDTLVSGDIPSHALSTHSGTLAMSAGGTGAALTPDTGAIPYSGAGAIALLAAVATAGKIIRSGANAAPTWSTATYPATAGSAGNVLRSDDTNFVSAQLAFSDLAGAIVAAQHGALGSGATHTLHALLTGAAFTGAISIVPASGTSSVVGVSVQQDGASGSPIIEIKRLNDGKAPVFRLINASYNGGMDWRMTANLKQTAFRAIGTATDTLTIDNLALLTQGALALTTIATINITTNGQSTDFGGLQANNTSVIRLNPNANRTGFILNAYMGTEDDTDIDGHLLFMFNPTAFSVAFTGGTFGTITIPAGGGATFIDYGGVFRMVGSS